MPEFEIPSGNEFIDQDMDYESMLSFFDEALIKNTERDENTANIPSNSHDNDDSLKKAISLLSNFLNSSSSKYSSSSDGYKSASIDFTINIDDFEVKLTVTLDNTMSHDEMVSVLREWGMSYPESYEYYLFATEMEDTWAHYGNWLEWYYFEEPPLPVELLARFAMALPGTIYGWSTGEDWMTGEELSGWEQALGILDVIPGEALVKMGVTALIVKVGDKFVDVAKIGTKAIFELPASSLKIVNYKFKHIAKKGMDWDKVVSSTKSGPSKFKRGTNINEITKRAWDDGTSVKNGKLWKVYDAGKIIGASNGKQTRFMRVELTPQTGELHASLISKDNYNKYIK